MNYIGLCQSVKFRIELGFAFVDDGKRLFKIDGVLFARIARASNIEELGNDELDSLISRFPTIFCVYAKADIARTSFINQEV